MASKTPEGAILSAVLDYLAARRILAFRMAVGATKVDGQRFMRWGTPGMADIQAFQRVNSNGICPQSIADTLTRVIWIEVKAAKGKQTPKQKSFQKLVESHGQTYIVARSIEDVEKALA